MFAVHGDWRIFASNTYVLQWFSGCWNEEAAIQYVKEYRDKTEHLKGTEWVMLSIFDDWELGVPEIASHVEQHCQRFKDIGCIKDCHVYSPSSTKGMLLEQLIPQTEGDYERQVFSDINHAIAWLNTCGYVVEVDEFISQLPR